MNRRILVAAISGALFLGGCQSKPSAPAPAAPPAAAAPAPAPAKASTKAPAAALAGAKIDCTKLIPQATRDQHFPGAELEQKPLCPGCPDNCEFRKDDELIGSVLYDCRGNLRDETKAMMLKTGFTEAAGPGKLAFTNPAQLTFWDETDCQVTVTALNANPGARAAIAAELEAALNPGAIGR